MSDYISTKKRRSDYICEHIFALILRFLPVKTILQFRCVSKGWKELIDSPFFIQEHLSLQKPRFFLQDDAFSEEYLVVDPDALPLVDTLNGPIETRDFAFLGTHHGVVCLYDFPCRKLLLWNPSIHKSYSVPLPIRIDSGWEYIVGVSYFGFWIDTSTKEFKFVMLNLVLDEYHNRLGLLGVLYSSIQRDWRVIPPEKVGNWRLSHQGPPVMIQGVAHWRGNGKSKGYALIILSFDFVHERFDSIEMPDLKCRLIDPILCHWQGSLSLMCRDRRVPQKFDVYLRQEGSWVKRFGLNFISPINRVFWVLGGEERVRLLADTNDELVLYDTRDGIISLKDEFYDAYISYDFVESLLFP